MIDEVEDHFLPVELLTNLALVDTPGTNAVIKRCVPVPGIFCWPL